MHPPRASRFTLPLPLALTVVACAPVKDDGDTVGMTSSSTSSTTAATSSSTSSTSSTTTAADPSTGASTGEATTGLDACPWSWPEHVDTPFCPPVAVANATVSGDTPYGPIELRYARFGLQLCAFPCPQADGGSLLLYATPTEEDVAWPEGDFLLFHRVGSVDVHVQEGSIAGQKTYGQDVAIDVTLPTVEETTPPLDEGAPPLLTGSVTITGDGWDVSGTFTAPLCTEINWSYPCE